VARGYARNFLLPRRLAAQATPGRLADLERRETLRARHEATSVDQAREVAGLLERTVLRFEVKAGPTGSLFGSVTPTDIVDELWRTRKIRIDRRRIELSEPIKRIGRYEVPIDVFTDVRVAVQTHVVPEGGELPPEPEPEPEVGLEAGSPGAEDGPAEETRPSGDSQPDETAPVE